MILFPKSQCFSIKKYGIKDPENVQQSFNECTAFTVFKTTRAELQTDECSSVSLLLSVKVASTLMIESTDLGGRVFTFPILNSCVNKLVCTDELDLRSI